MTSRGRTPRILTVVGIAATVFGAHQRASTAADEPCRTVEIVWNSPDARLVMTASLNSTLPTGITIPAPGPGESATVISSGWTSYDRYPDGASPTREDHAQHHEAWGISIGGTRLGGLTSDLPDKVSDGAVSPWYSGLISGSFGTGATDGGELVLLHSSLSGFTESQNSVHPSSVRLTVEYCPVSIATTTTAPPEATSTTVAPEPTAAPTTLAPEPTTTTPPDSTASTTEPEPTSTTAAPPVTQPSSTAPPTPVPAPAETTTPALPIPSTPVVATAPSTVPLVPAGPSVPTSTPSSVPTSSPTGDLPETGTNVDGLLQLGGALVAVGAALAMIRHHRPA